MKHNLKQSKQDLLGQYNTENVRVILENFKPIIEGRDVIDPFVGKWHLIDWCKEMGASDTRGYDIEALDERTLVNDYFAKPVNILPNELVVTNPPFLSSNRNKKGDRSPYKIFGQNDYYKCYLASLAQTNTEEAIIIIPTNFLCESSKKAREVFFRDYTIVYGEYWTQSIFKGVNISVCALHVKREKKDVHTFTFVERPSNEEVQMEISKFGDYRHGKGFFEYIEGVTPLAIKKVDKGDPEPNSKIIVSLLDKGKYGLGLAYNEGETIFCNPKSFTTYQIQLPVDLTPDQQKSIVELVNARLKFFRANYRSMFLGYYIDAEQKILSRTFIHKMITKEISNIL